MTTEEYMAEGFTFQKAGNYQEALACFEKATNINRYFTAGFYAKGFALEELGRYQEAIDSYDTAIGLQSGFYQAYNNKGSALIDLGMYSEAIKSFDEVISLNPEFPQAYNNKGFALQSLGMYQDAIECFDRAIQLKYDAPQSHYNRGLALKSLGIYEEAIMSFERARVLKPDSAAYLCCIASCKLALGRENEAFEDFKAAREEMERIQQRDIKEGDVEKVKEVLNKIIELEGVALGDEVKEERARIILNINFQKGGDTWDLDDLRMRLKDKIGGARLTENGLRTSGLKTSGYKSKNMPTNEGGEEVFEGAESGAGSAKKKKVMAQSPSKDEGKEGGKVYTEGSEGKHQITLEYGNKDCKECCSIF